jgi:hypothetical protein
MAGQVLLSVVGLGLDDDPFQPGISPAPHQVRAQQVTGDHQRGLAEKLSVEDFPIGHGLIVQ